MLSQICARDNLYGVSYYGLLRRQRNRGSQLASLAAPGLWPYRAAKAAMSRARMHFIQTLKLLPDIEQPLARRLICPTALLRRVSAVQVRPLGARQNAELDDAP
jgi:hypothetical protein